MARSDGDGLSRRQLLALTIGVWGIFFATLVVIAASLFYASTAWFWFFIADVAASTVLISLAILDARRRRRRDPDWEPRPWHTPWSGPTVQLWDLAMSQGERQLKRAADRNEPELPPDGNADDQNRQPTSERLD
jgi:hypothetical protein